MRLPLHWGASMIWRDVIKMETILFRPPIGEFLYCNVCVSVKGTRVCVCASEHKFGVATNHEKLRCDWTFMSNRFYLALIY